MWGTDERVCEIRDYLRRAEIDDLWVPVLVYSSVFGLKISVNDFAFRKVLQCKY